MMCLLCVRHRPKHFTVLTLNSPNNHYAQEDGRRGEITFGLKPHTRQRCSEGSNKTLCARGPRNPTETEPVLPLCV